MFISGTTAAEFENPHELTVDSNGLLFLQKDFHTIEGKRVLIFGTDSILDRVNHPSVSVAFADETFKISSKEFAQIWIVRVCVKGVNIPILYGMLENKSGSSYSAVLEFLRQRCPLFIPDIIVVDLEAAEHKSIQQHYPACRIQGYHFHFCKQLKERIQRFPEVETDPVLAMYLGCFYALPFLPLQNVQDGFEKLSRQLIIFYNTPEIQRFLVYFESTWISGPSTFAPAVLNVHEAVLNKTPRTNNASEGSNRAINVYIGATHPSLCDLIVGLRDFNAKKEMRFLQIEQTGALTKEEKPGKWWADKEERINHIVSNYDNNNKLVTLRNLGYNCC